MLRYILVNARIRRAIRTKARHANMFDYTAPDRTRCALVVVDAQQDYIDPDSPVRSAECSQTVDPLGRLVAGVRGLNVPIVHTVRYYRPDGSNVDLCRRKSVEEGMRVLMPGSRGAEPLPETLPDPKLRLDPFLLMDGGVQRIGDKEHAIYKPRWGAFFRTPLGDRLQRAEVNTLIVCGFNFGSSGRATLLEASERDYRLILVPDAAAGVTEAAQRELCRVGVHLLPVAQCLSWLTGQASASTAGERAA
jgi:nicotinamidase-related amidase